MLRERLVVAGLFGIPMLAASAMITWSVDERASAQTTGSASRVEPLLGFVEPSDIVDLACSEKGIIEALTIEEGVMVKQGQVICRLESSVENAALEISKTQADSEIGVETAKIGHELAEIQLQRVMEIDKRGAAARMELDEARIQEKYTRTQIAKAVHDQSVVKHQYERDRKVIDRRTVRSTLDGYVAQKLKSVGELLDGVDDTVICQIVKLDPLHVRVNAHADTYGKIRVGDLARLDAKQLPGGTASAKVILVDRVVGADSQLYMIKLELPNPDKAIPAGIKVTVTFP